MGYRCCMCMPAIWALCAAALPHVGHRLLCTEENSESSQRGGRRAAAHWAQLIQWMCVRPPGAVVASASTSILDLSPDSVAAGAWGGLVSRAAARRARVRRCRSLIRSSMSSVAQCMLQTCCRCRPDPRLQTRCARKSVAALGLPECARQIVQALALSGRPVLFWMSPGTPCGPMGGPSLGHCTPTVAGPASGPVPHAAREPGRYTPSSMGYRTCPRMPAACALCSAARPHVGHLLLRRAVRKSLSHRGGRLPMAQRVQLTQWM